LQCRRARYSFGLSQHNGKVKIEIEMEMDMEIEIGDQHHLL
jgi:hypothetical protein